MELHITSPSQPTSVVNNHHQGLLYIHNGDPTHYHQHYQTATPLSQIAEPGSGHWNMARSGEQMHMASSSLPSSNASSATHMTNSATSADLVNGEMRVTSPQMSPPGTDTTAAVKPKRDFRFQLIQLRQTPKWFIMPTHGSKHSHHKKDDEDEEELEENTDRQGQEANGHKENSNSSSSTASTSTTNTPSQVSSTSNNSDGSGSDGVLKNSSDQENVRPVAQQSNNAAKPANEISQQGLLLKPSMMCASHESALNYALVPNNFDNPLLRSSQCMETEHWETNSAFEILAVSDPKSEEEMAEGDDE